MATCPNGHQSGSDDWCEVCGHRMGAVPPPPPPPPPYGGGAPQQQPGYGYPPSGGDPTAQAELCPQCRTPREAMAPYCEECRWNFLTNTATSYTPLAPQPPQPSQGLNLPPGFQAQQAPPPPPQQQRPQPPAAGTAPDPYEYQSSRPSQMNRPAEPLNADPSMRQQQGPPPPPPAFQQQPGPPPPPQGFQQQQPGPPPPPQQHQQQQEFQQQAPPPPQAFQQQAPPQFQQQAPPQHTQHPQQTAPPQPGGDDWLLPPPSQQEFQQQAPPPPQQHQQEFQPQQPQHTQQPPQQQHTQAPQGTLAWSATIGPDREYFMAMMHRSGPDAAGLNLPAYSPEQQRPLVGNQITIGRRRHSTGESPDIDLSVPPEDPGVSHQHAVLVQQPDSSWAVVDQNSTNGTTINGGEEPIQPYVPVQLQAGDRVHVGAWTTITIHQG
ncbi:FHA domain-containing protein [Streptomyces sp. NBC_01465]|uniref:FHA domain-containing protein n=1 Tax=Streptomyces sp. NBC_01465 TaxID=2903878 RepID=UPI002E2F9C55|nr:FHA domain-containing protein [Streptomyces sp. NBC_01465]